MIALMMEAAGTSETLVNFYQNYTALQPRRQPSSMSISFHTKHAKNIYIYDI
jgi:hypothetical protein